MYYLPGQNVMDQTRKLQLGGYFAWDLEGIAPSNLVMSLVAEYNRGRPAHQHIGANIVPVPPQQFVRPVNTRNTAAANNHANWVM